MVIHLSVQQAALSLGYVLRNMPFSKRLAEDPETGCQFCYYSTLVLFDPDSFLGQRILMTSSSSVPLMLMGYNFNIYLRDNEIFDMTGFVDTPEPVALVRSLVSTVSYPLL